MSAPSPAGPATVAYVGHGEDSDIHVLGLDPATGDLRAVQQVTVPGIVKGGSSMPLAVSPDRRFLYAGLRGEPLVVATLGIDALTGRLSYLGSAPLADSMASIATDRSGRFLFSASYGGNKIAVNPIGPQGLVGPPQQVVPTEPKAHAIIPDPANRFVLATSLGGDIVIQSRLDPATGTLSPGTPPSTRVQAGAGPRHLVFDPSGRHLYVIGELDGSITVFDYDAATGGLSSKQVASVLPPGFSGTPSAADIHLTPDGRFLYGTERTTSTLRAFAVEPAGGTLTPVASYPTEEKPRGFAIDPAGRHLLAVGQLSDHLTCYRIDPRSGELAEAAGIGVGRNPNWVEIVSLP